MQATHPALLRTIPPIGEEGDKVATSFDTSPRDVHDFQPAWPTVRSMKSYHFTARRPGIKNGMERSASKKEHSQLRIPQTNHRPKNVRDLASEAWPKKGTSQFTSLENVNPLLMLKFWSIRFSLFGPFHLHNLTVLSLKLEQARRPGDWGAVRTGPA